MQSQRPPSHESPAELPRPSRSARRVLAPPSASARNMSLLSSSTVACRLEGTIHAQSSRFPPIPHVLRLHFRARAPRLLASAHALRPPARPVLPVSIAGCPRHQPPQG